MKKVLFISHFFPPTGGVESRININTVQEMLECKLIPTVICGNIDTNDNINQNLLHNVPNIKILRYNAINPGSGIISKTLKFIGIPPNPINTLNFKAMYKVAYQEIKENKYDIIYSVYGVGAAHLVGKRLHQYTKIPWVVEFQDPWIYNKILMKYIADYSIKPWFFYLKRKLKKLLKNIVEQADLIVVESNSHRELLIQDFGNENKIVTLPIGFNDDISKIKEDIPIIFQRKPVLGFIGNTYYGYDSIIERFIITLKNLEDEGYEFFLVSVGNNCFPKYAAKYNLRSFLPINTLSYSAALGIMDKLDIGIVAIGDDYHNNINSKIYELVHFSKTIIGLVPFDGEMSKMINKYNLGYVINPRNILNEIKKVLEDFKNRKTTSCSSKDIYHFSRRYLIKAVIDKIEKLI